jgi:preprotein translocase subunit SecG
MSTFSIFLVLITIVCFLLVVVIMVQNPKGGGLSIFIRWINTNRVEFKKTLTFYKIGHCTFMHYTILFKLYRNISDTDSKIIDNTGCCSPASPIQDAPATTTPK